VAKIKTKITYGNDRGATLVEYGLIAVVAISAVRSVGSGSQDTFCKSAAMIAAKTSFYVYDTSPEYRGCWICY
jgi:Flp pilus assembly pilin Flp